MRLLAVYNICGMGSFENVGYYVDCIRSLLAQTELTDLKVAISGCLTSHNTQQALNAGFGRSLSYNFCEEPHPVSVTFNDTVDKCVKFFGPFDGYLYVDSGVNFWQPTGPFTALSTLAKEFETGPYAIVAATPSNDHGGEWWQIEYGENVELPLTKATNMHAQIFTEEWRVAYGRILPDIFGSNAMESVFGEMAAALKKKVLVSAKVKAMHLCHLDGASLASRTGAREGFYPVSHTFSCSGLLYRTQKTMDERYREGRHLGFGFEGCTPYWPHDMSKYDENGFAKDAEGLKAFLRQELYLTPDLLDYSKIKAQFIPGE